MAASVENRNVMKEKDDDLSMFFEMRNREMGTKDLSLLQNSDDFDDSFVAGSKPKITSTEAMVHSLKTRADEFLDSENGKSDYDWLLTPPCTPLEKGVVNGNAKSQTTAPRSRLAEPPLESASRSEVTSSRQIRSASAGTRRSSSLGRGGAVISRPATPTGRPTLPATVKPLRSSTPSSRASFPSNKILAPHKRSSSPTRSTARSSTPTGRPSILAASKTASRSATSCQSSDQSSLSSASAPAGHSSSVTKSGASTITKTVPSRGMSPTVKSKPRKSSEAPGFSNDALPYLRTTLSGRPASVSKERSRAPNSQPSTTEIVSSGKPRQKPYSSSKAQVSSGNSQNSGRSVLLKSRKYSNTNDDVNPVLMGTQMVERVVNMRKLAPPKQDDLISNHSNTSRKPSSQESSGFGRSLSKTSLDMAIRHMDIGRSISGNMQSLMKDVPASSVYSLRSASRKVGISGASDSLVASSDASSERSFNINSHGLDGSEVEDIELCSDQGNSSSNSQHE